MCVCANGFNFEESDLLTDAYGGQERYDPDNFFRSNNAAIAPAAGRTAVTT